VLNKIIEHRTTVEQFNTVDRLMRQSVKRDWYFTISGWAIRCEDLLLDLMNEADLVYRSDEV